MKKLLIAICLSIFTLASVSPALANDNLSSAEMVTIELIYPGGDGSWPSSTIRACYGNYDLVLAKEDTKRQSIIFQVPKNSQVQVEFITDILASNGVEIFANSQLIKTFFNEGESATWTFTAEYSTWYELSYRDF